MTYLKLNIFCCKKKKYIHKCCHWKVVNFAKLWEGNLMHSNCQKTSFRYWHCFDTEMVTYVAQIWLQVMSVLSPAAHIELSVAYSLVHSDLSPKIPTYQGGKARDVVCSELLVSICNHRVDHRRITSGRVVQTVQPLEGEHAPAFEHHSNQSPPSSANCNRIRMWHPWFIQILQYCIYTWNLGNSLL